MERGGGREGREQTNNEIMLCVNVIAAFLHALSGGSAHTCKYTHIHTPLQIDSCTCSHVCWYTHSHIHLYTDPTHGHLYTQKTHTHTHTRHTLAQNIQAHLFTRIETLRGFAPTQPVMEGEQALLVLHSM